MALILRNVENLTKLNISTALVQTLQASLFLPVSWYDKQSLAFLNNLVEDFVGHSRNSTQQPPRRLHDVQPSGNHFAFKGRGALHQGWQGEAEVFHPDRRSQNHRRAH